MGLFDALFGRKTQKAEQTEKAPPEPVAPLETLMTSQLPALYLHTGAAYYHENYLTRLKKLGFTESDAEKMFGFESDIIRRHEKPYLLRPDFAKLWFFGLKQPFFQEYPKTKMDVYAERYFTMSELCKFIDEAEWHVWNSHEKDISDEVWAEIYAWRMKGPGIEFASQYFDMIERVTGIPANCIGELCAEQGSHLNRFKWG